MNPVIALLVFVGIPVAFAVIVAAFVYGSSWSRGGDVASELDAGPFLSVSDAAVPDPSRLPSDTTGAPLTVGGISATGAPVPGRLGNAERAQIRSIVQKARTISGFRFAAYCGPLAHGRASALEEHASLSGADASVLVAIDPATGAVEVVSGSALAPHLDARDFELAALSLTSCLSGGDLVEAMREGVLQLAQRTRPQVTLHLDQPA